MINVIVKHPQQVLGVDKNQIQYMYQKGVNGQLFTKILTIEIRIVIMNDQHYSDQNLSAPGIYVSP